MSILIKSIYFILLLIVLQSCHKDESESINQSKSSKIENVAPQLDITENTGKFVINPQFKYAYDFHEEFAAVFIGNYKTGKFGFIDKQGKMKINPQFEFVSFFSEGLAVVRVGDSKTGKYGYIDKQGNFVINPQFDDATFFKEGLAVVRVGNNKTGKMGYIARR